MIDAVGGQDLAPLESGNGRPGNFFNPVIAPVHHGMKRIFVLNQQRPDLTPHGDGQETLHHSGIFRVTLHQLGGDPGNDEGRLYIGLDQLHDPDKDITVVRCDIGPAGTIIHFSPGEGDYLKDKIPNTHVF